jgi:hypothetical protein
MVYILIWVLCTVYGSLAYTRGAEEIDTSPGRSPVLLIHPSIEKYGMR